MGRRRQSAVSGGRNSSGCEFQGTIGDGLLGSGFDGDSLMRVGDLLTPSEACETSVAAHHIRMVVVDCARDCWNLNLCDFEAIHGLPDLKDLNNL